jgi:hypothetical protein
MKKYHTSFIVGACIPDLHLRADVSSFSVPVSCTHFSNDQQLQSCSGTRDDTKLRRKPNLFGMRYQSLICSSWLKQAGDVGISFPSFALDASLHFDAVRTLSHVMH